MSTRYLAITILAGALFGGSSATARAAANTTPDRIDGLWTWDFAMPDGSVVSPKARLKRDGEKLAGVTSFRPGSEMPIEDGAIQGDEVRFQVVRERDGRKVITRYSGRIEGGTIRGKIESDWAGDWQTYDWVASKPLVPPNSVWRSVVMLPDGIRQRWRMTFKQDHDRLTGKITTSSSQPLEVKDGRVVGDEVMFAVDRRRTGGADHFEYRGRLEGDTITGKVQAVLRGEKHTLDWTAARPPRVVDGRWTWTHAGAKRQLTLRRSGEKLTGKFIMDETHEYEIANGRFLDSEIYFEVERERDAEKTLTRFRGTLGDDRITGKIEFTVNDAAPQTEDWQAEKMDSEEGTGDRPSRGRGRGR